MSIFYNLSLNGTRDNKEELRFDSDQGNELLLANQSQYQVGVARFKIPINRIPLYRIYDNELHLNSLSLMGGVNGGNAPNYIRAAYTQSNVFGFDQNQAIFNINQIYRNYGLYGIDPLRNNQPFLNIYSHTQFVEVLNNALIKSINKTESVRTNNIVKSLTNTAMTCNSYVTVVPLPLDATGLIATPAGTNPFFRVAADASAAPIYKGSFINGFTLTIKNFNKTNPVAEGDFSDLSFYLVRGQYAATKLETTDYFPVFQNILKGVSKIDVADGGNHRLHFSLADGHNIDAQTQIDKDLYEGNILDGVNHFSMYPSSSDFAGIYGQRMDSPGTTPFSSANQDWSLIVINRSNGTDVAGIIGKDYHFATGDIEFSLTGSKIATFQNLSTNVMATTNNPRYDYLFPQFRYDSEKSKIYLSRSSWWDVNYGLKLVMNRKLRSLLTFDEYKCKNLSLENYGTYFLNDIVAREFKESYSGSIYNFPARISSLGADESLGGKDGSNMYDNFTPINHYESFDSRFARDWLDGLILISGSIATQGEIVGNGAAIRKVITDFVTDPSTIRRDYLVYESNGKERFYPLVSTSPLYKVDVFVKFKDIWGYVRPLEIEPNMVASIKIEFRPNNMIQNYI